MIKHLTIATLIAIASSTASASQLVQVDDITKTVIQRTPYQVEVCTNQTVRNDTTGDMIVGGIIGGLIGNQIGKGGGKNAATGIGALTGAIIANDKNAGASNRTVCSIETRYNESSTSIYSHSIITFIHEGRKYRLQFTK
jgi:outer membrane lipoprotein SlyB